MIVWNLCRQWQRKREHRPRARLDMRKGAVQAFPWVREAIRHSRHIFAGLNYLCFRRYSLKNWILQKRSRAKPRLQ